MTAMAVTRHRQVIVIGAGQAGLATAHWLMRAGIDFAILDARAETGGSWRNFYDSLTLFSPARYSGLPGMEFPGDRDRYPRRDEVVRYLANYAGFLGAPIHHGADVVRVKQQDGVFITELADGNVWTADRLISAAGLFGRPHRPHLPGQHRFAGKVLHAAEYRRPAEIGDGPVAIVGGGNSALQIALELAEERSVHVFVRQKLRFLRQRLLGRDIHFWLRASGYDTLPLGRWFGLAPSEPVLDPGIYRAAQRSGRIVVHPMFASLQTNGALLSDGSALPFSTLIQATGYDPIPAYLDGVSTARAGYPQRRQHLLRAMPGLSFVGLPWQTNHASATLRGVGPDARRVVAEIARSEAIGTRWQIA